MAMIGTGRRVLLIGGEGVVLYAPSGAKIAREAAIAWDMPEFEARLSDVLAAGSAPVMVLFDGADQTYRKEENIPKLTAFDRPRFIKRKLELAFPSYPIRAALEIKPQRVKGAAPTPLSYLFVALPETDQIDRVGRALYESGVAIAGFGLLPAESASLVTELSGKMFGGARKSRWSVLIGQHETGGLRQIVVKDGNLALTRLTPTGEAGTSGATWAEEAVREFRATLTYISRFGFSNDDGLDVMIVCGNIEREFIESKGISATNFRCVTTAEAMRQIGASQAGLDKTNFADGLHAAWASKRASLKLPIVVPSIERVRKPRQSARLAAITLALTAAGLGALMVQTQGEYQSYQSKIADKQNQKAMLQREYDQESKIFDGLPIKPEAVKAAMEVRANLEETSGPIAPVLFRLKKTIGDDIRFRDFTFKHDPGRKLPLSDARGGADVDPTQPDPGLLHIAFSFKLPDTMTLEDKVKRTETLAANLRAEFPKMDVRIVSQFGKVSKEGKFQGEAGVSQAPMNANTEDYAEMSVEGSVP